MITPEEYPKAFFYKRIVQAKLFIDSRYSDKIDVDNIADEACFSKYHFIREFKKVFGRSPHQYLVFVRLENAKRLLRSGRSVAEVCTAVGFESIGSFSALFKRTTGFTPSGYGRMQLYTKHQIAAAPLRFVPHCFAYQSGWSGTAILEKSL